MNYIIIKDETKLREFIDWLPILKPHEMYYITLFARKKYIIGETLLKSDKAQLKSLTSNKEMLFDKIKQLECEVGSYKTNGVPIPQEALALYISVNPRDMLKATSESLIEFAKLITKPYSNYNPHQVVMSKIQTSSSNKIYFDMDFDKVSYGGILKEITDKDIINIDCLYPIQTRGGVHLLIKIGDIKPQYVKSWYNNITKIEGCDVNSDILLPVVGCTQGNFTPHFIK